MCLAVPVEVVELLADERAVGMQSGVRLDFSSALVPDLRVGDFVLVHTGIAIERIDADEAHRAREIWHQLNPQP